MSRFYKSSSKYRKEPQDKERCVMLGEYIIETNGTVRETAAKFGISKSTVHKDVTEKLIRADKQLYSKVRGVLAKNKAERHLRGGQATKLKYTALREKNK